MKPSVLLMRISVARNAVYALHMPHTVEPGKEYIWQGQGIKTLRTAVPSGTVREVNGLEQ